MPHESHRRWIPPRRGPAARVSRIHGRVPLPFAVPRFAGDGGASKPPVAFRPSMDGRSPAPIGTSVQRTRASRTDPASPPVRNRSKIHPRTGAVGLTSRATGPRPGPTAPVPGRRARAAWARQTACCVLRQDLFGALRALPPAKNRQRGTLKTDDNSSITTATRI